MLSVLCGSTTSNLTKENSFILSTLVSLTTSLFRRSTIALFQLDSMVLFDFGTTATEESFIIVDSKQTDRQHASNGYLFQRKTMVESW